VTVNPFDRRIVLFVNGFVHHSRIFDNIVVYVSASPLLTGGILMALLWWAWAECKENRSKDRETLIFGLLGSILAGILARAIALSLPFRLRPLHNPELHLQLPYGLDPTTLMGWSSFPSDHAALYFCLATTIWMVSRRLGIIAMADVAFVVCLPRLYEGVHYPTDLLVGTALGIGVASLAQVERLRTAITRPMWPWLDRRPGSFYAVLFVCTAEVGTGFNIVHDVVKGALDLLQTKGFAGR
jgi:undecaprenyl-diphosphatase